MCVNNQHEQVLSHTKLEKCEIPRKIGSQQQCYEKYLNDNIQW